MSGTRIINGVRTVYVDGRPRFATADVASILEWNVRSIISCLPDEMLVNADVSKWHARNGDTNNITTIDEDGLRKVVALATSELSPVSNRRIWIDDWTMDLLTRSRVASYEEDDPMCDFQIALPDVVAPSPAPDVPVERRAEAPEPVPAPDVQAEPVTVNGTVRVGPFLVDLRKAVRRIVDRMSSPLDILEQAVTYIDGFRLGCRVGLGSEDRVRGLDSAFEDLAFAEDGFERAVSELEELANGGDAE